MPLPPLLCVALVSCAGCYSVRLLLRLLLHLHILSFLAACFLFSGGREMPASEPLRTNNPRNRCRFIFFVLRLGRRLVENDRELGIKGSKKTGAGKPDLM